MLAPSPPTFAAVWIIYSGLISLNNSNVLEKSRKSTSFDDIFLPSNDEATKPFPVINIIL